MILDEIKASLHRYYYDCQASGESVSALKLKNKLCSTEEKPIKSTMQLFDKFITEYAELVQTKGYGKEALIRYKICKNRVQEFLKKEMHADDIPVESINKRTKTEVPVNVPLLEVPMRLIKKYEPLRKGNLVFPVYSNQKSNDYLKEIAALCDIHKDVTFHVARHTFATTVTLENGVPIESVSKMLGHTNVQTTQIYARITERKINLDMDQLSKKLDPQADVYKMPESEYRARKSRKLRRELQEFALANGVPLMN